MAISPGVFGTLPQLFFSPLASPNREHYAAFLVMYYRIFQESSHGVERTTLVSRFTEYISLHRGQFSAEEDSDGGETGEEAEEPDEPVTESARYMASRFLRTLMKTGWVSEETLPDYTKIVNMSAYAKPFFESLARVEEGLKTEYESHVVAVYSLLTADAALENGHYAVLNAHTSTIALIDSLKVLSQSIRNHYERLSDLAGGSGIKDLLHLHYDLYAGDILDGAYKRLKTSDNLSRYRPRILRKVSELSLDDAWLDASAQKYARLGRSTTGEARTRLAAMLEEIRDTLKAVDPLLEEIDRRNMLYARASIERVKTLLEPDSTIAGQVAAIIRAVLDTDGLHRALGHHLYAARTLTGESRYRRWLRERSELEWQENAPLPKAELERAEAELRLRLEKQLSPSRIAGYLDALGGKERLLGTADLVGDMDSFVRFLYAVLYADSRSGRFVYAVEDGIGDALTIGAFTVPDLVFRRKP